MKVLIGVIDLSQHLENNFLWALQVLFFLLPHRPIYWPVTAKPCESQCKSLLDLNLDLSPSKGLLEPLPYEIFIVYES